MQKCIKIIDIIMIIIKIKKKIIIETIIWKKKIKIIIEN